MSDITIPGFSNSSSTIDTEKLINDLIEVERIPLNRIENRIESSEEERIIWQELGRKIDRVSTDATFLYGFQTPFRSRVGNSSNNSAVELIATRNSDEAEHTIHVNQLARRDRFSSVPFPNDYRVPAGRYGFQVGDNSITFSYSGGTLADFSNAINDAGDGVVSSQVVRHADGKHVIVLSAETTGTENSLQFLEDAREFGLTHGIIREVLQRGAYIDNLYVVSPGDTQIIDLESPYRLDEGAIISYQAQSETSLLGAQEKFAVDSIGSVTLREVTVPNIPSRAPIEHDDDDAPHNIDSQFVTLMRADGSEIPLSGIEDSPTFMEISIPLEAQSDSIVGIKLYNTNTHRTFKIKDIALSNLVDGNYEPINPIEQAANAQILFDGVPVERSTNSIDDLIPGTTIELRDETAAPISVEVAPDYESVKGAVINLLGNYNQLMRDINILTRNDSTIIDELEFLDVAERDTAQARLGVMNGDSALNQLRNRLITIMHNSYQTSAGRDINLLIQIGIGSNVGDNNTQGVDQSRLRGYIEMDEEKFDAQMQAHFDAIGELFGNDLDRDLTTDSGVAYEIDRYVDLYGRTGGIVDSRISSIDQRIQRDGQRATTYTERLDDYEQKLRQDFGRMQGALNTLDEANRSLQNLNPNNNQ